MVSTRPALYVMISMLALPLAANAQTETGADLANVFAAARTGAPIRAVALGGSITQAGQGWIAPWLKLQFLNSLTSLSNAGMSATGSQLGVFRLERDVLSVQPNLVLLETTVNDGGLSDEEAVRSIESVVVRLKSQNPPPAIVVVHSAHQKGLNKTRHSAVAKHYGLLEIDLDTALKAHIQNIKRPWGEFMSDDVHPNDAGNAYYAEALVKALKPYAEKTSQPLNFKRPKPISSLPLWLDGKLVPLRQMVDGASGWNSKSTILDTRNGSPVWWNQFFNGVLSSEKAGASLEIPFRGTAVGVLASLQPGFGSFLASIDGGLPQQFSTGTRDGYEPIMLSNKLTPGEHRLTIVLPNTADGKSAPVNLGALLVAGGSVASKAAPKVGSYNAELLRNLKFEPLLPAQWRMAGPFDDGQVLPDGKVSGDLETPFAPELKGAKIAWQAIPESAIRGEIIDFAAMGPKPWGIRYAETTVKSQRGGNILLRLSLDYFAKVWINGREIYTVRDSHGHPRNYLIFPATLKAGENTIRIKLHPGSGGADFSLAVAELNS